MTEAPAAPPAAPDHPPNALPVGTRLGEFELRRVIGVGGFGIVYLALDHALQREVAVKEYMPAALAGRTETLHVSLRSQSDAETFALGLKSFVNEARLLARFELPSLVRVFRFWEANGTAYMAMPVVRGQTLKALRSASREAPDEDMLRTLLAPLLDTLEALHAEGVYHRDIAPDNIVIEAGGRPVLLDLGAARRVIGDKTQTLTAILKPAYAPIEQYAEAGSLKQGPWTDLYALGATLHYLVLGKPPAPATTRTIQDEQAPLAGMVLPGISPGFAQIVDWMLAPRPADRPQNAAMLRDALAGRIAPVQRTAQLAAPPAAWERTQILPGAAGRGGGGQGKGQGALPGSGWDEATAQDAAAAAATQPLTRPGAAAGPASAVGAGASPGQAGAAPQGAAGVSAPAATAGAARGARRALVPALLGVALAAVAGGGWLWGQQDAAPRSATAITIPMPATPGVAMGSVPSLPPARDDDVPPAPAAAGVAPGAAVATTSGPTPVGLSDAAAREPRRDTARETARQPSPPSSPAAVLGAARPAPMPPSTAGPARDAAATGGPSVQPPGAAVSGALSPVPAAAPSAAPAPGTPSTAGPLRGATTGAATLPGVAGQAATAPAPAAPPSPDESCGRRYLIALTRCMERECARPELRQHPQCVAWRDEHDRRTNIKN